MDRAANQPLPPGERMSLAQAGMLIVGAAMFFFPEPITSVIGATLVLGAFGMEDKAPV